MKDLLQYLSPFAPDLAGAVAVLFELDGLIVICDAGGCTGNICGFDEPRWFTHKSALFSAGLRDMDAILGRDKELAAKLIAAAQVSDRKFLAMIGSPVPAVIATDFGALKRMCRKELDIPVMAVEASGTLDYEVGASLAYMELFKTLSKERLPVIPGSVGVLGVTPLDYSTLEAGKIIRSALGESAQIYGMGAGLEAVKRASAVEKNIVTAPCGLRAAQYLERTFGTPYEIAVPGIYDHLNLDELDLQDKKVLIIHQVFAADALKNELVKRESSCQVQVGSFFNRFAGTADFRFDSEADLRRVFAENDFDLVIGDMAFKRVVNDLYRDKWCEFAHFAVSGKLLEGDV